MASQISSGNLISDRYASALYDLSAENKVLDFVIEDFNVLKKIIEQNKKLQLLLKTPLIASNEKLKIFLKIMESDNLNKMTSIFLNVISNNKRFSSLLSIISHFLDINAKKRGAILADVTSADKLSNDQQKNISDQLKKILGDKLSLNFKEDKKIIGGLIIKVGSKMIDASLANKINKLKIVLKEA